MQVGNERATHSAGCSLKRALVLSRDPQFFDAVKDALVVRGAAYDDEWEMVQLRDPTSGHLFTFYEPRIADPDHRGRPVSTADGVAAPDLAAVDVYVAECPCEKHFASVTRLLAAAAAGPTWVLDGDGVVWAADDVDPARVRL